MSQETLEVRIPDIGDDGVEVVEVFVTPGEPVAAEQSLISVESDKATMELPAPSAGEVLSIAVSVGASPNTGDLVATIKAEAAPPPEPESTPHPEPRPSTPAPRPSRHRPPPPPPGEDARHQVHAGPAVRRFARELGADLTSVEGSGRRGRIVRADVEQWVKAQLQRRDPAHRGLALPEMPDIDFSRFGEVEDKPLSRIRKLTAASVHRSWLHVPHVTQHDEADITELEAFRQQHKAAARAQGCGLTLVAFLMKVVARALQEFPDFNSSLHPDGDRIILKRYHNIGIAVETPRGLVVPVVRDVDKKGVLALAADLAAVSQRARDGKLTTPDIQGATFTISSLGGIGGTAFTPIVNAPEVAILGVSRAQMRQVYLNGSFVPRLVLPLSLSYDHRVIDGAAAVRFTTRLGELLGDLRTLIL